MHGFAIRQRNSALADAFGAREAIWAIAGLTAASGIVVAVRMYETHPREGAYRTRPRFDRPLGQ